MENVIAVGTGDVFHRFIAPSLEIPEFDEAVKNLICSQKSCIRHLALQTGDKPD